MTLHYPRHRRASLFPVLFLTLLLIGRLYPAFSASFEDANKLYYEGKFLDAVNGYESLKKAGLSSPAIYFNLGNAFLKSGQLGRAIIAYRRVERLTPRDPDVRANLQFARNQAQGPTLGPARWQISLARLTLNEWTLLSCCSIWISLLLAAAWQWRPHWRRSLRGILAASLILSILLGVCLGAVFYENQIVQYAVVITKDAVVRNGPLEISPVNFTLHDGSEVRVLERNNDWLFVTTDPRRKGWLRRDQVALTLE